MYDYSNLGGDVYKQRISRQGESKAGAYRAIIFLKSGKGSIQRYRGQVMNRQYRDEIAKVTHDMMKDFQQAGAVSTNEMWEFEKNCFISGTEFDQADEPQEAERPKCITV